MQWADRIGRRIKLRDLHVLQAVVASGSMTKAAGQLAISVPVVSKAIADLEHTVGVPLLDRSPQGVEPTAYGRALLTRSVAAFDELRQGVKDIEFLADPTAGEVRIGTTPPLAASFVCAVIDRLSRRYPRIVFHVVIGESGAFHRELRERNVDLLIARNFGLAAGDQVSFESLYDNPYVVVAGANNPWVRRRRIALAELADELWALPPPDSAVGSVAVEAFRASGLDFPRATVIAFAHEMRINLLATGRYITVLPESVLRFPVTHPLIRRLPVELPITSGPIGVMTLTNRALNPVARLFIDCAREVAKSPAKPKNGAQRTGRR